MTAFRHFLHVPLKVLKMTAADEPYYKQNGSTLQTIWINIKNNMDQHYKQYGQTLTKQYGSMSTLQTIWINITKNMDQHYKQYG